MEEGEASSYGPRWNLHEETEASGVAASLGLASDSCISPVLHLCPLRGPPECGNY